ncbi:hypothetical protein KIPB_013789, partial [Kipferlia bialata]
AANHKTVVSEIGRRKAAANKAPEKK